MSARPLKLHNNLEQWFSTGLQVGEGLHAGKSRNAERRLAPLTKHNSS